MVEGPKGATTATAKTMATTKQLETLAALCSVCDSQHAQLRISQLALITEIARKPGQSQSELATAMGLTLSAISRAVDVLGSAGRKDKLSTARMGWIEARESAEDERIKAVFLTDKGEQFVGRLAAAISADAGAPPYCASDILTRASRDGWIRTFTDYPVLQANPDLAAALELASSRDNQEMIDIISDDLDRAIAALEG